MKCLLFPLLLFISSSIFAETYSCVTKEGEQIILTREGNQFIQRIKSTIYSSITKQTTLPYKITFENEKYIRLNYEVFVGDEKTGVTVLGTTIVHIDKEKRTLSQSDLINTDLGTETRNVECVVIP